MATYICIQFRRSNRFNLGISFINCDTHQCMSLLLCTGPYKWMEKTWYAAKLTWWTHCRNRNTFEALKRWHSGRAITAKFTLQNRNCWHKSIIYISRSVERIFFPSIDHCWQEWVYYFHRFIISNVFTLGTIDLQMAALCCTYAIISIQFFLEAFTASRPHAWGASSIDQI